MSEHENAKFPDLVCNCGGVMRSTAGAGWTCTECSRQSTISGRFSIRDPEPYRHSLKSVARAYVRKYGEEDWADLGPIEDVQINYDYTEAEQAIIDAWWPLTTSFGQVYMSRYYERGDEVS